MNKFTPGPWRVGDTINDIVYADSDSRRIAVCGDYPGHGIRSSLPIEQCIANAKLISIAPEMYELLENLVDSLQRYGDEYSELEGKATEIKELLARID